MEIIDNWQDWVIGIGQILFLVALIPSIVGENKPDKRTSLMTAVILTIFTFTFWTLGLYYGSFTSGMVAVGWYVLFFQRLAK